MSEKPPGPVPANGGVYDPGQDTRRGRPSHTIASLRLDIEAANTGRTWLLLPEGFRDVPKTYPLPTRGQELQILAAIYIPPRRQDAGCQYLRRAVRAHKDYMRRTQSQIFRGEKQIQSMHRLRSAHLEQMQELRAEVRTAVAQVQEQAREAIASMTDLFSLGRRGIDAQMRAHLENKKLPSGETISASAFRECFRMVTQAVKGLGLPSEQRESSRQAVIEQAAEALEATRSAIALAPGTDPSDTVQ